MTEEPDQKIPHYYGHRRRLRDRFNKIGSQSLQEYEILELLLTYVIPQRDVKPIAKKLLERFGSIKGIFEAAEDELQSIPYIKEKFTTLLRLIREINFIYMKQKLLEKPINNLKNIADFCIEKFGNKKEEEFHIFYFDANLQIMQDSYFPAKDFYFQGSIDKTVVYPRRIIEEGLKQKAYGIIIAHNHPNGILEPSESDKKLTEVINIATKSVGLTLLDHIIVTSTDYFSFKEAKLL